MLRQGPRRLLKSPKAVVYAVLVHILLVGLIVVGWQWHRTEERRTAPPPTPVQAEVVDDARVRAEVERLKQEEQRKRDEESARQRALDDSRRRAEEAERKRQQEEARLDELKKRAAAEERRQAEARQKAEAERKRRATEAEQRKVAEAERKRAAEQAQAREAAERRAEAERALREQLASEESPRQQALEAQALAAAERYKELIRQKVERNWLRPAATAQRLSCVVGVRLAPGGDVLDARVVRSSGNAAFDRSVENAVFKASPLPVPSDGRIFEHFRELEFLFSPKR